ncbi:MAG TPA: hypothetical protein DD435_05045 [Cyanobacteria bacterium UBA8530]|nr:hypothetical protein [Cyanobacteria bacterium UBA8530]
MGCESQAHQVIRANLGLTDNTERSQIQEAVKAAIAQTPGMLNSNNTKRWLDSLVEGVAPHHAGLLPPLKLLIETLFQRGLIKIVFATETLAAGINMPAKTVVLSSLSKRTDDGNRNLTVGEFHQMTGRAGRRGMDKIGYVVTLASTRYSPDELVGMIRGKVEPLRSRFTLNYNMVSNLIHRYELPAARRIVEQCFSQFQNNHAVQELLLEKKKSQDRLTELTPVCPGTGETLRIDELESFRNLKSQLDSLRKRLDALESVRQYLPLRQANNLIENTPIGGWLLVHSPGTPLPQIAILLSKQPVKSGDIRYGVLLEAPNPQQLEARTIQQLGPKHLIAVLPGHRAEGLPGGLVKKSERLNYLQSQEFGNPDLPWREWVAKSGLNLEELNLPVEESPEITKARAKHQKLSDDLTGHPCARCRLKRTCLGMAKEHNLLSEAVRRNEQEVELIRSTNWRQFLALQAVLNQAGYMRERELLARGVAIAHLRTSNALIAAEAIASGRLDDLPPHALAAATSGVMAEPVRGKHYWHPMRHGEEVEDVFQHLFQIARHLQKVQEKFSVDQTVTVVSEYAGITQAWAKGAQWNQLIEPTGIDEGTLVRHLRQVIDLLTQFKEIPGLSEAFKARLMEAAHLIDRDIVKEVF